MVAFWGVIAEGAAVRSSGLRWAIAAIAVTVLAAGSALRARGREAGQPRETQ